MNDHFFLFRCLLMLFVTVVLLSFSFVRLHSLTIISYLICFVVSLLRNSKSFVFMLISVDCVIFSLLSIIRVSCLGLIFRSRSLDLFIRVLCLFLPSFPGHIYHSCFGSISFFRTRSQNVCFILWFQFTKFIIRVLCLFHS